MLSSHAIVREGSLPHKAQPRCHHDVNKRAGWKLVTSWWCHGQVRELLRCPLAETISHLRSVALEQCGALRNANQVMCEDKWHRQPNISKVLGLPMLLLPTMALKSLGGTCPFSPQQDCAPSGQCGCKMRPSPQEMQSPWRLKTPCNYIGCIMWTPPLASASTQGWS